MILFDKVFKSYNSHYALEDINLTISHGEFVSVVGQSGAGKSTLLKLLTAEEKPTEGKVFFDNRDLSQISKKDLPLLRRRIGTVYQDFKLLPKKTVFENVAFALEVCGISSKRINQVVPQVLKIVGLKDKTDRYPFPSFLGSFLQM